LELLGIPKSRIIEVAAPFVQVERLAVVRGANASGVPHHALLGDLRRRLRDAAGVEKSTASSRLFISRSKTVSRSSSQRRILNQHELETFLSKENFETVHPETLPFSKQVSLFSGASVIAGAHGAGMYNLIFASPGTPVLEFYTHSWWDHAACRISSMLEMPHFHLFSESADKQDNFIVPIGDLDKILADILPGDSHARAAETLF
jgi:capsular polysaccharide biosynthesis protein